ncbi:S1 RNA-binding domain-containing protein [Streptomyces sp. NPDC059009]|uniref:S1 RNA-binding domain-containing protein n=1 Tax=Streptomyces sp. NPDC059009 TaxID=3346694 RepID=UPI003674C133
MGASGGRGSGTGGLTEHDHPELCAFLASLRQGELLSGTVAAIERFGVFVALDDGPGHPVHPGVGFITIPELAWQRIEAASDVVQVGQHVTCEFLQFDDWNLEARLSLRAMRPDPFQAFADEAGPGRELRGQVTKLVPFGVFVRVAEGIEGLIHGPEPGLREGDDVMVRVTEVDRERRRVALSPAR